MTGRTHWSYVIVLSRRQNMGVQVWLSKFKEVYM
jgi:hypothetical protein